jgi:hypothetical protein
MGPTALAFSGSPAPACTFPRTEVGNVFLLAEDVPKLATIKIKNTKLRENHNSTGTQLAGSPGQGFKVPWPVFDKLCHPIKLWGRDLELTYTFAL